MVQTFMIDGEFIIINGERLYRPGKPNAGLNVTQVGSKVYVNGYEWKKGRWRRTLPALFHYIFS